MTTPSLSAPRKIPLRLKDYYQQYVLPQVVSNHRLWVDEYDIEAVAVKPAAFQGYPQYYRVTFSDGITITLFKDHLCEVEILPGTLRYR